MEKMKMIGNEIYDKKILLIDDEVPLLDMIEVVLKKENFTHVYRATSGQQAIRSYAEINPDVVVLDIMLPDMEGYEVCRKIRETSMVPILFLSAKSEEIDRVVSFKVGGDDYLAKPFSTKELVARIGAILRRQSFYENKDKAMDENRISFGTCEIDLVQQELYVNGKLVDMPAKEYFLLE